MANFYEVYNQDPREHCALEKAIITAGDNAFLFTTLTSAVFIGTDISSNVFVWDNPDGVILTRYNGTGGPVFFNTGNIKTSLLLDSFSDAQQICKDWIVASLKDIGIDAVAGEGDSNDVMLEGKKICGIGTKDIGDKVFLPFFFTLDIDFDIANRCMNLTKHTEDIRERAIGINQVLRTPITADQIRDALKVRFEEYFGERLRDTELSKALIDSKDTNLQEVYNHPDWLKYGRFYD